MQVKVTKTVKHDIELITPAFYVSPNKTEWLGIINEDNVISMTAMAGYRSVSIGDSFAKDTVIEQAFNHWQRISEEEFLGKHEKHLRSLSLRPMLSESPVYERNVNDLKDISIG